MMRRLWKSLGLATALVMVLSTVVVAQPPAPAPDGPINTLRVYGRENVNAAFPYLTFDGPFNLKSFEAPPKDFVQFNPAFYNHWDHESHGWALPNGTFFHHIKADGDASEKVHLRMWYVPEYMEPAGATEPPVPANPDYVSPDIVMEYTYTLLDPNDLNPTTGGGQLRGGTTQFAFPMAGLGEQPGLDRYDVNGDGTPEIMNVDYIAPVVGNTTLGTIAVSPKATQNLGMNLQVGDQIQFFDYMVELFDISSFEAKVEIGIYYIGNRYPQYVGPATLVLDQALNVDARHGPINVLVPGAPWYLGAAPVTTPFGVSLDYVGTNYVTLTPHRILQAGESFFVDGAEYDVAAIYIEDTGTDADRIKYITLRNPIPKYDEVCIEELSVCKEPLQEEQSMWLLPPFNMTHDMVDDVNIPEDVAGPDLQLLDNPAKPWPNGVDPDYNTIPERIVEDVGALDGDHFIGFIAEEKEERFDTNLGEEKIKECRMPDMFTTIGSVEALEASNIVPRIPLAGQNDACFMLLSNGPDDSTAPDLGIDFDGDAAVQLDNDITSATFNVNVGIAGANLSFDWMFLTSEESEPVLFDDFAWVEVDDVPVWGHSVDIGGAGGGLFDGVSPFWDAQLTDNVFYYVQSPGLANGSIFDDGRTGWNPAPQGQFNRFLLPGPHKIEILIADQGNHIIDSGLVVDDLTLGALDLFADMETELWRWINIETHPWDYTEFILPPMPDVTAGDPDVDDKWKSGDYIVVTSYMTEDSGGLWPDPASVRAKFAYDAEVSMRDSADIYVNDAEYNMHYRGVDANSLRVYGRGRLNAAFPYLSNDGPFNLKSFEAPPKDFVVYNPAFLDHWDRDWDNDGADEFFYLNIKADNDASEKVHLRTWYVPLYEEPAGQVEPAFVPRGKYRAPDIVNEYTYLFVDPDTINPRHGSESATGAGVTQLVFPMAGLGGQVGLDRYDVNGDGTEEIMRVDLIEPVDEKTPNGTIAVSARETQPQGMAMQVGDQIQFFDYMVELNDISTIQTKVDIAVYYIGNHAAEYIGSTTLFLLESATVDARDGPVRSPALGNLLPPVPVVRPFWVTLDYVGNNYVTLTPHRWLTARAGVNPPPGRDAETFFVDGAEYDVAAILVLDNPDGEGDEVKYITLRNPLPKYEKVCIEEISVCKEAVQENESLPMLPPFNHVHDMIDDVNLDEIPEAVGPDLQLWDNPSDHLDPALIEDRIIPDIGGFDGDLFIGFIAEEKEERFDTNLFEEKWTWGQCPPNGECWMWLNIETMPWDFTEFVLPELPDITASDADGDYILVSSWMTEDSAQLWPLPLSVRMKFAYDAADGTGIYVNTRDEGCFGDFNDDGMRDTADIMMMVPHWNTACGDADYVPEYDVDNDCDIDLADIMQVVAVWNTPCP